MQTSLYANGMIIYNDNDKKSTRNNSEFRLWNTR